MSDYTIIFTEEEREQLCLNDECEEHGHGTMDCSVPSTKDEAKEQLRQEQIQSADLGVQSAQPKQATGEVVRSDE